MLFVVAIVWEGGKALFAIPSFELPHLHEILGDFLRQGAGGEHTVAAVERRVIRWQPAAR